MKIKPLLVCLLLGALPSFARSETVIKILHIQANPQILLIFAPFHPVVSISGKQGLPLRIGFLGNCTILHCPIQKISRRVFDSEYVGQFDVCDLRPTNASSRR